MKAQVKRLVRNETILTIEYEVLFTGDIFTVRIDGELYEQLGLMDVVAKARLLQDTDLIDIKFRKARFAEGVATIITHLAIINTNTTSEFIGWID